MEGQPIVGVLDASRASRLCAWAALGFLLATPLCAVPITALVFSPDGEALVSNGDRRLDVRSPRDATLRRHIPCELERITALAFAPDGGVLAVGGGDPGVRGRVLLISWPDGKVLHRLGDHTDVVTCVAFNLDGTCLGAASSDATAQIWRIRGAAEPGGLFRLKGHAGPVLALAFSPSGQSIVTTSTDRSLKVWDSTDGQLRRSFGHHTEAIPALTFRAPTAGETRPVECATAGDDRTVRVWQPELGRMVRIVRQHESSILALAWSPDGAVIFSAGKEGVIRAIDSASDTIETTWRDHEDWIYALAIRPDGSALASGDWSGRVHIRDLRRTTKRPAGAEPSKP